MKRRSWDLLRARKEAQHLAEIKVAACVVAGLSISGYLRRGRPGGDLGSRSSQSSSRAAKKMVPRQELASEDPRGLLNSFTCVSFASCMLPT